MSKNRMAVMAPALEHIAELIVFAFSDNISAENYKLSADSGSQRSQLLECMCFCKIKSAIVACCCKSQKRSFLMA